MTWLPDTARRPNGKARKCEENVRPPLNSPVGEVQEGHGIPRGRAESSTGLVTHPHYLAHDCGTPLIGVPPEPYPFTDAEPHLEQPRRIERVSELLHLSGVGSSLAEVPPRLAYPEDLELVHSPPYIRLVADISARLGHGDAGPAAPVRRGSYEVAALAAGGAVAAVDAVMSDRVKTCYVLSRPPGHHALRNTGMGFCLFNNVALAAAYALTSYTLDRILILDWDVHHGNGTQSIFYEDNRVLFVSIHQEGLDFTQEGSATNIGAGDGIGYTVNIPLPAGTGDAGYLAAFDEIVGPIAGQYRPQLILVSCGFDASWSDPFGSMLVSAEGFRSLSKRTRELAKQSANNRAVFVHEGGYSLMYAPFCTLSVIEELLGTRTPISDLNQVAGFERLPPTTKVGLDASQAIEAVRSVQSRYWCLS